MSYHRDEPPSRLRPSLANRLGPSPRLHGSVCRRYSTLHALFIYYIKLYTLTMYVIESEPRGTEYGFVVRIYNSAIYAISLNRSFTIRHVVNLPLRRHYRTPKTAATFCSELFRYILTMAHVYTCTCYEQSSILPTELLKQLSLVGWFKGSHFNLIFLFCFVTLVAVASTKEMLLQLLRSTRGENKRRCLHGRPPEHQCWPRESMNLKRGHLNAPSKGLRYEKGVHAYICLMCYIRILYALQRVYYVWFLIV